MKILRWFNYRVYKVHKWLVAAVFLTLLAISSVQVVLRLGFHSGIAHAETLQRYLVLWVAFSGAVLATFKSRHINLDIISKKIRAINPAIAGVIVSLTSLALGIFMLISAIRFIIVEYDPSNVVFFIPVWVLELIIPSTFFFMCLMFLQKAVESVGLFFKRRIK